MAFLDRLREEKKNADRLHLEANARGASDRVDITVTSRKLNAPDDLYVYRCSCSSMPYSSTGMEWHLHSMHVLAFKEAIKAVKQAVPGPATLSVAAFTVS